MPTREEPDVTDPHPPTRIVALDVHDVRFPTSRQRDGSDAMNPFPDYSAAYVVLRTAGGEEGYGLVFTVGRGNDLQAAAIKAFEPLVVGADVDEAIADMGGLLPAAGRRQPAALAGPGEGRGAHGGRRRGQRRLGPGGPPGREARLAAAQRAQPEQLVDLVDFRYLRDALTEDEALAILRAAEGGRAGARPPSCSTTDYPAYTTTPGWLGYDDDKLARLCREAVADGFSHDQAQGRGRSGEDVRRLQLAREAVGPDFADRHRRQPGLGSRRGDRLDRRSSAAYDPYWIEEPTSPDDVLGHAAIRRAVAPIRVATGEHTANPVMFKQLLQAEAIDVVQIDACRVAGSTRTSRSCCWPRSSACRSARTPAGSGCARWCSTSPCSTSSRSAASWQDR